MKKILIGICGLGNGHIVRQRNVISKLMERKHRIVLLITADNKKGLDAEFPSIKKIIVKTPWVFCDKNGVNFKKTKSKYLHDNFDWYNVMLTSFIEIERKMGGVPDLVISDYEPNSAQYSYARNLPLICLEQQSKFLGYQAGGVDKFSPNEETSRLLYFFPIAQKRYVSSFFPLENNGNYNVETIPPIIEKVKVPCYVDPRKIIVYFSPYGKKEKEFIQILNVIKNCKKYYFYIYSAEKFDKYKNHNNLIFKKIGNKFSDEIKDSSFIISTAGHQLISESINIEKPILLSPLNTFEQNYNAKIVKQYGIGNIFDKISIKEFNEFTNNIDKYRNNMKLFKKKYWKKSWEDVLMGKLKRDFDL